MPFPYDKFCERQKSPSWNGPRVEMVPELKQWQAAWAKRISKRKSQAEFAPSDSPWERPCFNSDTVSTWELCLVYVVFFVVDCFRVFFSCHWCVISRLRSDSAIQCVLLTRIMLVFVFYFSSVACALRLGQDQGLFVEFSFLFFFVKKLRRKRQFGYLLLSFPQSRAVLKEKIDPAARSIWPRRAEPRLKSPPLRSAELCVVQRVTETELDRLPIGNVHSLW